MNKFQINECPLCGKVLRFRQVSGVNVFDCSEQITWEMNGVTKHRSHYEVEFDKSNSIQRMYVLPYNVDNFQKEHKSRVYKWTPADKPGGEEKWRFVVETPHIRPDISDRLLERIQKLVTFL